MTDWIVATAYSICGAMLVMMVIGIAFSAFMPALDKKIFNFFASFDVCRCSLYRYDNLHQSRYGGSTKNNHYF